jgi:excisionase family DNA binding protein
MHSTQAESTARNADGNTADCVERYVPDRPAVGVVSAISVEEFCRRFGVGRTLTYELIKTGKLKVKKCGRRTLIPMAAAQAWFDGLPTT